MPEQPKPEDTLYPFSVTVGQVYDGPLDLLLDLIRKQDLNIWDIPIARITAQFLSYVEQLKEADVDNAGEFIYTAALLIQIKSKMLLPKAPPEAQDENEPEDPRAELVERLLQHERFKNAAALLAERQQIEAATWTRPGLKDFLNETAQVDPDNPIDPSAREIAADVPDLVRIFQAVLERARNRPVLDVEQDAVSVGKMIGFLRRRLLLEDRPIALSRILQNTRSERALIAMFLALLELVRLQAILLRQDANFTEVFVKKQDRFEDVLAERMEDMRDDWA
jgi:segregation and condensation protein A